MAKPITFECAGNGRALLEPRPVSQPWLTEAVGTAEWGGTPLAPLLDEAGASTSAVEVLFSALDRGIEGGEPQTYERALPIAEAERRAARLRDERRAAPAPARLPAAARGAGLVRHAEREVAHPHHRARGALHRLPERGGLPDVRRGRRAGRAGHAHAAALADGAARGAGLHDAHAPPRARTRRRSPAAPGPDRADRAGRGLHRRRRRPSSAAVLDPPLGPHAWRGWSFTGTPHPASTS